MLTELDLVLRLIAGAVAGLVIGFDRQRRGKTVGLRTLALVGLGTATVTAMYDGAGLPDAQSRVVQGVLTGIGFLGAGAIVRPGEGRARGLTTAAATFVTAALGCSAGSGQWAVTITGTVLAFLLLLLNHPLHRLFGAEDPDDREEAD